MFEGAQMYNLGNDFHLWVLKAYNYLVEKYLYDYYTFREKSIILNEAAETDFTIKWRRGLRRNKRHLEKRKIWINY